MYEQYRRANCIASDLIMGNEYVFRVFSANLVGLSLEACNTKDSAFIQKKGDKMCVSVDLVPVPANANISSADYSEVSEFLLRHL